MKVSTSGDDLLIIHCERFESGKVGIKNTDIILTIGLSPFFVFICISQFSLVQFESYLNKHLLVVLSITFFLTTIVISAIHDIFFKSPSLRTSFIYQVDRNGCFSSHNGKVKIINGVNIEDKDNMVESFKIFIDMPIESYEEDAAYTPQRILYKVLVKLSTGKCFSIEENSMYVFSHPDTEVAFSKLTTATSIAIDQIKSFLEKSKN